MPPSESKTPELELLEAVVPELLELDALELLLVGVVPELIEPDVELEALEASVPDWLELAVLDAVVGPPVVTECLVVAPAPPPLPVVSPLPHAAARIGRR